ncbi:hypothetical protein A2524_00680 [Candidatus Wolfebacteria bacterium RIFOXYD12_FULL_48_21]|uniref:Uncharacterized protein n=1 Tax=Candidatus Wolfebacteria bacterium RIFOXYD1_FULL_48_65 TaxID=1802561 RepID=A0A1F8E1V1_9BACT|nr:MAG: hypothetical protein A2610_02625 [Candidatus Wolfebacteria bacterium RIFOXYD1_FULL_48_65]OGM94330.1 MAG: hypothetical protein A2524_00680 [Candidatus Wolfebacteria bacterium RIFOXYD12_FULL_48_21]OGM96979.1 MAG: hypothetical protein A2532_01550 [Candidatus Wolfebacteria bacterium RIFOXYD2_FULL_48_11]
MRYFLQTIFAATIVLFFIANVGTVFAAEGDLVWTQVNNPSAISDAAGPIAVDASGIYVAGYDTIPGNYQWRIEKRSLSDGAVIWTKTSNPSSDTDYATAIAIDASGIYVAGYDYVSGRFFRWRIEKRSLSDGAVIWTKTNDPSASHDIANAITIDASGIYVAGFDSILANYQWRIEKRSLSDGAIIWTKTNNPSAGGDYATAITVDASGIYVAGVDAIPGNNQWRIEKRSLSDGAVIWTQTSNPSAQPEGVGAITVDASGIYVVGDDFTPGFGNSQWRIEKRSLSDGAVIWTQTSNPSASYDGPGSIAINAIGIYVAGFDSILANYQWRIEKHSLSDGAVIWTKTNNPSASSDVPGGIAVDAIGIYVAGNDRASVNDQWRIEKRERASFICAGPFAASWTDSTITANSTKIRKVHIDELRSAINTRRIDAGLTNYSWTDPTITANSTKIRKVHIDDLRTAISQVYTTCGQAAPSWTDPTITANTTKIRKVHIDELRSAVSNAQ